MEPILNMQRNLLHRRSGYEQVLEVPPVVSATSVSDVRSDYDEASTSRPKHLDMDFNIEADPEDDLCRLICPGPLSCCLSPFFPVRWLFSVNFNREKEAVLAFNWGEFSAIKSSPGLFVVNPFGMTLKRVSLKEKTTELRDEKLVDLKGNPVICSGVVFWRIEGVKAASLNVEDVGVYVKTCALAALKSVVSKYPYEADKAGMASLKTEGGALAHELNCDLQKRLAHAGVRVIAFNMTDLSYAPEIAQAMLVRQQAEAMVKARRLIVKGAVDISEDAVSQLEAKGVQLSKEEKTKVVTNLLTVICGDQKATPTLSVG